PRRRARGHRKPSLCRADAAILEVHEGQRPARLPRPERQRTAAWARPRAGRQPEVQGGGGRLPRQAAGRRPAQNWGRLVTAATRGGAAGAGLAGRRWLRRPRGRRLVGAAVLLAAAGVLVAVTDPFAGKAGSSGALDNGTATSLATVVRRSLSSQQLVDGTLGYAGSSSIVVPQGTSQADLRKAKLDAASAEAALRAVEATLSADEQSLAQAQAKLTADRLKQASDCRGAGPAGTGSVGGSDGSGSRPSSGSSPCGAAAQAVASDEETVSLAEEKVTTDRGAIEAAR